MSKIMAYCSAMWSDIRKLEHITQQYEHCSRNHSKSLGNMSNLDIALVKDSEIRVGHLIEVSLPGETPAIMLRKKLTKLQFQKAMDKIITTESLSIIQRTQPKPSDKHIFRFPSSTTVLNTKKPAPTNKSTVTESESIGANHLGFAKFLFQHYCQHLGLNYNQILAESAFNFYVNERIAYLLGTSVNTESVRKTFYHELIQNTSLPINYNFTSIITEINKKIEHHIQQRYPITYASKGKKKLQIPAKKHRIESSTNPSYHYTSGSTINIALAGMSILNTTLIFEQFPFQNFRITDPWEPTKLEKEQEEEEEESENQKFTYQNPITENPDIVTPNFQTQ
ncbi:hypothetical protein G9A89_017396 [Geosiphon pyriformis]|nr:hypothetical protein G9A89_017396 [Geosiphon pyriformis]